MFKKELSHPSYDHLKDMVKGCIDDIIEHPQTDEVLSAQKEKLEKESLKVSSKQNGSLQEALGSKQEQVKENPYENKAGPSLYFKALERVRRLNGYEAIHNEIKVKGLPEEVLRRKEELERELDLEAQGLSPNNVNQQDKFSDGNSKQDAEHTTTEDLDKVETLFYNKAKSRVEQLNLSKSNVSEKIKRNFKLFIIIIVAFIGYYIYGVYFEDSDDKSLQNVQAQLPIELDDTTTLTAVDLVENNFTLKITKSQEAFKDSQDQEKALNLYIDSAKSNFCKIPLFLDMIKKGKKIVVIMDAKDDSFHKEFSVSKCDL